MREHAALVLALTLLAGCGGDGSPSAPSSPAPSATPVPVNGLAVMVSATGHLAHLTSGGPTGLACGMPYLSMEIRETRGGTVQAADFYAVITNRAGAPTRWQGTFSGLPAFPPNSVGWLTVNNVAQCILMPASWDFRINTTDAAGTVTQLHGSGKLEIR